MFVLSPFFAVNFAFAASGYVDTNVDFVQGLTKGGATIDVSRSDETRALGVEDGDFVSLGYGGVINLAFPTHIGGGALSITAFERTNGVYPLEEAEVWVSGDSSNWIMIGIANNLVEGDPSRPSEFVLNDECIKFVRLIDITDSALHNDGSDGFDLDAVGAEYESECELEEPCNGCAPGNDIVINRNEAFVMNRVSSSANTGGNYAGGSYGGDGGDAGDINGGDVNQSSTGDGGVGGDASTGGTVFTGNAYATTSLYNEVNSNTTSIEGCGCESGNVVVYNRNRAVVMNDASSWANTGDNVADGSYAGRGGDGGSINPYEGPVIRILDNGEEYDNEGRVDESMTGEGGAGGNAGEGGFVQTGESRSSTTFVNVVNRNLTRILR